MSTTDLNDYSGSHRLEGEAGIIDPRVLSATRLLALNSSSALQHRESNFDVFDDFNGPVTSGDTPPLAEHSTIPNSDDDGLTMAACSGEGDPEAARKLSTNLLRTYFHTRRFTIALSNAAPRLSSSRRMQRNRLVQKGGICNISLVNVPRQGEKYFRDIFTTVIEMKWRWCLLVFCASFTLFWSLFTFIYYLLLMYHGDFEHLVGTTTGEEGLEIIEEWRPCIVHADSALNIFIFAFTTQSTIGYGYRYPSDECPLVVLTMCIQWMVGLISQTLMAGVIFAKLARPKKRAATIIFSKNAVICMRDGKLCLLFRVGDMRKSSLAEAHVRLQMIKKCITMEGELLPFHQFDMNVGYDSGLDRVFVIWPITICHEIDASSPLYEVNKASLANARFEIIAILEGVVESVGSTTQARTSYLPDEILWGKRFEKLVTYQRDNGDYRIDFSKFHNVYDVPTPEVSAKEMDQMRHRGMHRGSNTGSKKASMEIACYPPPVPNEVANERKDTRQSEKSEVNPWLFSPSSSISPRTKLRNEVKFRKGSDITPVPHHAGENEESGGELNVMNRVPSWAGEARYRKNILDISPDARHDLYDPRFLPLGERPATASSVLALLESPDTEQRRKTSFQVRRGPDLF